jgi:hypothetical protein
LASEERSAVNPPVGPALTAAPERMAPTINASRLAVGVWLGGAGVVLVAFVELATSSVNWPGHSETHADCWPAVAGVALRLIVIVVPGELAIAVVYHTSTDRPVACPSASAHVTFVWTSDVTAIVFVSELKYRTIVLPTVGVVSPEIVKLVPEVHAFDAFSCTGVVSVI